MEAAPKAGQKPNAEGRKTQGRKQRQAGKKSVTPVRAKDQPAPLGPETPTGLVLNAKGTGIDKFMQEEVTPRGRSQNKVNELVKALAGQNEAKNATGVLPDSPVKGTADGKIPPGIFTDTMKEGRGQAQRRGAGDAGTSNQDGRKALGERKHSLARVALEHFQGKSATPTRTRTMQPPDPMTLDLV